MSDDDEPEASLGLLRFQETKSRGEDADDDVDETNEDGVLFYVNKGGFPINSFTWDRMWTHVAKLHPDGAHIATEIRRNKTLPEISIPKAPLDFPITFTIDEKLEAIQMYMNELQYNHTGTQFFEIRKNRPISGLMESAKEMIKEALPIKCLEAVILSLYLTNGMTNVDRFPISFKTVFMGNVFRHVVLGIYSQGRYGALGMSRRKDLMYKPLEYRCLSDLVNDYIAAYRRYFHEVKKAKVGLPVPHDCHSYESICWKHLSVTPKKKSKQDEINREIDRHAREMRQQRSRLDNLRSVYSMGSDKLRSSLTIDISPPKSKDNTRQKRPKKPKPKSDESKSGKVTVQSAKQSTDEDQPKPVSNGKYQIRV